MFFKTSNWPEKNIIKKQSDAGYYNISSPFLTSVDLICYQGKIGGINRMLAVLEELTEELDINDLKNLLSCYKNKSVLQRLGFLLEELGAEENLISILFEHLQKQKFFPVLLNSNKRQNAGKTTNKWKVDINIKLESDL